MLDCLPPELVLNILSHCDAQTLSSVQLANRDWSHFIAENESAVYHAAALYHRFAEPSQTLGDASTDWSEILSPGDREFQGWKDFCHKRFQMENNWEGRGSTPGTTLFRSTGKDVHRFKLDERKGARFIITTHRRGGLKVSCMDTDTVLFELGKHYVRHFAHCEYENGFLIFDRFHPHELEIWRLSNEWDGIIPVSNISHRPDLAQLNAPVRHVEPNGSVTNAGRGSFSPWALFTPNNSPRAYRFVYPTLLVGSESGQELHVFDVPSTRLVETIRIPQVGNSAAALINYVELGARHVFVCTPFGVLILPRFQSHGARNVGTTPEFLDFPSGDSGLRIPQLVRQYAAHMEQTFGRPSNVAMREFIVTAPRAPERSTALVRFGQDRQEFSAVHVSPDGKNFIAITIFGVAYLVRDFERVFRGEVKFSDIALRINMGTSALNLAFEHDRAVIQTIHGIFILCLHASAPYGVITPRVHPTRLEPQPAVFPELSAHQLLHFRNPLPLRLVSCVKLTRTAVWLDWSARALEEVEGRVGPLPDEEDGFEPPGGNVMGEEHPYATRMVCRVDFAPRDSDPETASMQY